MSDATFSLSMPLPLDSDGFLRRECPTCEREFKWFASPEGEESEPIPEGGYFCPYCGIQAQADTWLSKAQVEQAQNLVATEVATPMLQKFATDIADISRRPGGLVSAQAEYEGPERLDPLTETDDMRRVDFVCHPSEPIKVLDDWDRPVHCLICGETLA